MMSIYRRSLPALLAAACTSWTVDVEDSGIAAGDTAPDETGAEARAPWIASGMWTCVPADTDGSVVVAEVEARDPQGEDSIAVQGLVETYYHEDGGASGSFPLVCDDEGDCSGSVRTLDLFGDSCPQDLAWVAYATVYDVDGNPSEPYPLTWEAPASE
jgi:hypothetical protein